MAVTALAALAALAGAVFSAHAAEGVALSGRMGERALLVIDGQSQLLSPGQSAAGVRLLRWQGDEAIVERGGRTSALRVGGAPVALGGAVAPEAAAEVVISAGLGGHFSVDGAINGRAVRFMVDTGATVVALGRDDAQRLGLDLSRAVPVMMGTANGSVRAQRIMLARVRVGGIELTQVEAVVLPAAMPSVLLGNSFLSRLQMRRENDVMRLQRR